MFLALIADIAFTAIVNHWDWLALPRIGTLWSGQMLKFNPQKQCFFHYYFETVALFTMHSGYSTLDFLSTRLGAAAMFRPTAWLNEPARPAVARYVSRADGRGASAVLTGRRDID